MYGGGDVETRNRHRLVGQRGHHGAGERCAFRAGRTLLVLDTVTGADGERLYARQGWQRCGVIPGYALWPDGRPCDTTIFFKALHPASRKARSPG